MNILNKFFRNEKLLINIYSFTLLGCGLLFGIAYYIYGNQQLLDFGKYILFCSNNEVTNNYSLYLSITGVYIVISLFIATSFLGMLINSFIIFSRGMLITIATINFFTLNKFGVSMFFVGFIPQILIELFLTYIISIVSLRLSLNCFTITFLTKEVFNCHKIINYILDYIILIMIIITISMAFKVYVL